MLKLKKLQILGFKSFCDRTELKFNGEGIAAVVGPNGCGKSNIADAISWVLGEQSAKSLRGVRMEDVIFAGTRDRKPTGMAEVSLALIDPDVHEGPALVTPEVAIENEMPEDDWDEASVRSAAAEEVDTATLEAQPGRTFEGEDEATPADGEANASLPENARPDVVLKIRRRRFKTQFKAGEIVVTRRLFRSGDSEYLLNGKICRLRDIQEIFMGTGLGPESYAIIEQGRIGQILSSKPHDRRAIIEEAAGITKYKTKKRLAEARLEQAKLNLSRVNDIFEEVTRQMNSLKRQAAKAERYARLREEMRDKLRVVLASRFSQLERETSEIQQALHSIAEKIRLQSESMGLLEQEHTEKIQQGYALEQDITNTRESLGGIRLEMERAQARRAGNEERCTELLSRVAASETELARTQEHLQSLSVELAANQAVLESAAADVAAAQQEAQLRNVEATEAAAAVTGAERAQEAFRSAVIDAMNGANLLRNQITQAEENVSALDRESSRLQQEICASSMDIETMGGKRGQLGLEFESVNQCVSGLNLKITDARAQLEQKRSEEKEAKQHLDSLRAEYATALGQRNSLQAVISEHGYSTESVRRLFQSGGLSGGRTPAGVLADFLEVDDKYEGVVEDFLRDELNFVVVKSWDAADEGLRLLRSDVDGRATFLVHPSDAQAKFSFAAPERSGSAPQPQSIVPLKNCIRVLNGFGKSLEVILPKLRDGFIAPDAQTARDLALGNPDAFFLAPSGETFHNVTVTGGKQRSEGPLSLKRELRDLLKQMGALEVAMAEEESRTRRLAREIEELTALQTRLDQELRAAEREAMTHGHALSHLESEIARIEQRIQSQRLQLDAVAAQRAERQESISQRRDELAAVEQRRTESESAIVQEQQKLSELKSARETSSKLAAEASARLAGLQERHRAASDGMNRIQTLVTEVRGRTESLAAQIAAAQSEQQQRTQENVQLQERIIAWEGEQAAAEARVAELQALSEQMRMELLEIEQRLKNVRAEMDLARDRRGELGAAAAKLESDTAHLSETCLNDLGVASDELAADASIVRLEGEGLTLEDNLCREMKARLEGMGPVNMMALEEYKEIAQRHEFLETQRKDLLDSIENTQNTIREIDTISREKFEEAFHKINENFQRTFMKLFGGGQAFMRLTDIENSAESGIDIVASPPGKKLQNVLLLSGGEKALTALSLLVGIFHYQPSPFCILDEVDAPLDEANVGRFADMVKEMSAQTQFILITHSKRTMSASPVLYGVTMQEPGVSKVVSVRFGESVPQAASA